MKSKIKKIALYWIAGNMFTTFAVTVNLIFLAVINNYTVSYYAVIAFIFYMTSFFIAGFITKYVTEDFNLFFYGSTGILNQLVFWSCFLQTAEDLTFVSQIQLPLFLAVFMTFIVSCLGEVAGFYVKYYVRKDFLKYWALGNLMTLAYILFFLFTALTFNILCQERLTNYIERIIVFIPFFASGFTIKYIRKDLPFYYYGTTGPAIPIIALLWLTYSSYECNLECFFGIIKDVSPFIIIASLLGGFASVLFIRLKSMKRGLSFNYKYDFITLLNYGNMGEVYLAERLWDKKKVVIKKPVFSPEIGLDEKTVNTIYAREGELLSKFDHPGLPELYGFFEEDGRKCIVMEYIEGRTLEYILKGALEKPVPLKLALRWVMEIGEILDYLHNSFSSPVVYKDLKPSNIIITRKGKVRLIDFGTSRYYSPDKNSDTYRLGTPGYAAPEQYKKTEQTTPRTDVFSMGVILYHLLTNYDPSLTPFKFPRAGSLNPAVNYGLEKIIMKAIALEPFNRFMSVRELIEELEKYLNKKAESTLFLPPSVLC